MAKKRKKVSRRHRKIHANRKHRKTSRRHRRVHSNKKHRKTSRRHRKVHANRKHRKASRRVKAPKFKANRKHRKSSRRRKVSRNPIGALAAVAANPKRSRRRHKLIRRFTPLPTMRRPIFRNTLFPVASNYSGRPVKHAKAARKGVARRRSGKRGYSLLSGFKLPVFANPGKLIGGAVGSAKGYAKTIMSKEFLKDVGSVTIGNIGAPIAVKFANKYIGQWTGGEGKVATAVKTIAAGMALSFLAKKFAKSDRMAKYIAIGAIAGVSAGLAKEYLVPKILGVVTGSAAGTETVSTSSEEGLAGPRAGAERDATGLGAYATAQQIRTAEEF